MSLEEPGVEPLIERRCAECDATLTDEEIVASQDAGGPFLCSVHAAEDAPAEEPEAPADDF